MNKHCKVIQDLWRRFTLIQLRGLVNRTHSC